jgi:precorrin-6A/cobalt-precorrin-6A reductase
VKLLLLGGTADARQLAQGLQQRGIEVIYSIAGLVRQPVLDCRVLSGGFSAQGGLDQFVMREAIGAILDATHPYAQRMSATALAVARAQGIPLWRYQRPPWQAQAGDDWQTFADWSELPPLLRGRRSVFFTAGQLTQAFVEQLQAHCADGGQRQILRTAIRPEIELPESMTWIEDIGPFDIDSERDLFARYRVDALVSKNSGGAATVAKLSVARERRVPVFLLRRPLLAAADAEFSELRQCLEFVAGQALVSV